jgi:hypothetical protein
MLNYDDLMELAMRLNRETPTPNDIGYFLEQHDLNVAAVKRMAAEVEVAARVQGLGAPAGASWAAGIALGLMIADELAAREA